MTTTTPQTPIAARQLAVRLLVLLAVALLAAGTLVGFLPTSAYGVDCGSAFAPSRNANVADVYDTLGGNSLRTGTIGGVSDSCADGHSTRRTIAIVVVVAAAAAGVAAGVTRGAAKQQ